MKKAVLFPTTFIPNTDGLINQDAKGRPEAGRMLQKVSGRPSQGLLEAVTARKRSAAVEEVFMKDGGTVRKRHRDNKAVNPNPGKDPEQAESSKLQMIVEEFGAPKQNWKFACPFYKHDPDTNLHWACRSSGFSTVHRVK